MPKQMNQFFKDPDNPTEEELIALFMATRPKTPTGPVNPPSSRTSPLTELTAQRLILSMEALTLALQENTQAMVMEPQEDSTDSDMDDSPPPSLMHPGKIEH